MQEKNAILKYDVFIGKRSESKNRWNTVVEHILPSSDVLHFSAFFVQKFKRIKISPVLVGIFFCVTCEMYEAFCDTTTGECPDWQVKLGCTDKLSQAKWTINTSKCITS